MFRFVVFDLDGTLIDSRRDIADAANALLVDCGASQLPEDTIGRMVGDGAAVLVRRAFEAAAVAAPPDALDRFLTLYNERLLEHTKPYPGIPHVLATLASRGPLALLTNKPIAATRRILSGLELDIYFQEERVIGGDGPFARKPDPAGVRHLLGIVGVRSLDTVLVGDSMIDWRTARNAGTAVCLVRYGFGFDGVSAVNLSPADRVVDVPGQLLECL